MRSRWMVSLWCGSLACSPVLDFELLEPEFDPCAACLLDDEPARAEPDDVAELPAAPATPEPPRLPCPSGWTETEENCEPFSDGEILDCPAGWTQLLGDAACRPLGGLCPDGRFPDPRGSEEAAFVDPTAVAGGLGTRERPFRTIDEALAREDPPATLLLSSGVHRTGGVDVTDRLVIRGLCAARTEVRPARRLEYVFSASEGGALTLENIRIDAEQRARGVQSEGNQTEVSLIAVQLVRAADFGIAAFDGSLVIGRELVVDDVRNVFLGTNNPGGLAVLVSGLATVELERSLLSRMTRTGLQAQIGGTARIRRTVIRDGLGIPGFEFGALVVVGRRSLIEVSESFLARGALFNVFADEVAAEVRIRDSTIREGKHVARFVRSGFGIKVDRGASALLERVRVERAITAGIEITTGSALRASDVRITETRTDPVERSSGSGLVVADRSQLDGERIEIVGSQRAALAISQESSGDIRDVRIERGRPPVAFRPAYGLFVNRSGVRARRVDLSDLVGDGIRIMGSERAPFDVVLEDVAVRDTTPLPDEVSGFGLWADGAGSVTISRGRFDAPGAAMRVEGSGLDFEASDLDFDASDRPDHPTLEIAGGARADVSRARFGGGSGTAIEALDDGSDLVMTDIRVGDLEASALENAVRIVGARATLERVRVEHAAWGLRVGEGGELALRQGRLQALGGTQGGGAIDVRGLGRVSLADTSIIGVDGLGVRVESGEAELDRVTMEALTPSSGDEIAPCLQVANDGEVWLSEVRCAAGRGVGILSDSSRLISDRLRVEVEPGVTAGIAIQGASEAVLERTTIVGAARVGVSATETASVSASSLRVEGPGVGAAEEPPRQLGLGCTDDAFLVIEGFEVRGIPGIGLGASGRCRLRATTGALATRDAGILRGEAARLVARSVRPDEVLIDPSLPELVVFPLVRDEEP